VLNEPVASFWQDTELNDWINWAIRELAAMIRVESNNSITGNTVNGTGTLTLGAGVMRIVTVRANSTPLKRIVLADVVRLNLDLTAKGSPTHYYTTIDGSTGALVMNWYPIPDAAYAYQVYTVNELTDLTSDTGAGSTPAFPARHHHRLLSKVWAMAYAKGGRDYGASTGFSQQWEKVDLPTIVADLMNTQDEGYTIRYVDPEQPSPGSFNPLDWP
jgi:hypothetical protein